VPLPTRRFDYDRDKNGNADCRVKTQVRGTAEVYTSIKRKLKYRWNDTVSTQVVAELLADHFNVGYQRPRHSRRGFVL
jgi:hypothetical protein